MNDVNVAARRGWRKIYLNVATIPFWGLHIAAIAGVAWLGFSWTGLILAVALYFARMFFVTAGYHRYFAHRSFKTSRFVQFLFALGASTTLQKGVLWWASHHRRHHRDSDTEADPHTPVHYGFWWSHLGWIVCRDFEDTDYDRVSDLTKYRELRIIDKLHLVPPVVLAVVLFLVGGWHALIWGFAVSTVLLWHGTFTINSLAHVFGRRRYQTSDTSKNSLLLALITMGEGWHNNHHHFPTTANQGFFWWEVDLSYYVLVVLSRFGLAHELRKPPAHVLQRAQPEPAVQAASPAPTSLRPLSFPPEPAPIIDAGIEL